MIKKIIMIAFFVGLIIAYNMLGLDTVFSFEMLKEKKELLLELVQNHFLFSAFLLTGVYALSVSLMVPVATLFSLAAGFMSGAFLGLLISVLGATLGAVASFYIARFIFQKNYSKELECFNSEFETNGYNYLFALRLLPIFPFFLINLFSGLTHINVKTFFITTFIGIISGGFVYTYAGSQLSNINEVGDIFTKEMGLALLFLGLISLIPVLYQKWNHKKFENKNA